MFAALPNRRSLLVVFVALIVTTLACTTPSAGGGPTSEPPTITAENASTNTPSTGQTNPQPVGASPVPQGPTATAGTVAPTVALTGGGTATYQGVSFFYDYSIISKWEVATAVKDQPGNGPDNWLIASHYEFTFPSYPVTSPYQPARILVFPTANWQNYNPEAVNRISQLTQLLKDKPATFGPQDRIPVVPVFNADQVFRVHVNYIDFQNGTGVRFVTQWAQAPLPVVNGDIYYTFQGLTSDGKYNIAAFFPLTQSSLPTQVTDPASVVGADFAAYLDQTTKSLNSAPDDSFYPALGILDKMMQSISIP